MSGTCVNASRDGGAFVCSECGGVAEGLPASEVGRCPSCGRRVRRGGTGWDEPGAVQVGAGMALGLLAVLSVLRAGAAGVGLVLAAAGLAASAKGLRAAPSRALRACAAIAVAWDVAALALCAAA